jgi:hypothetical protein
MKQSICLDRGVPERSFALPQRRTGRPWFSPLNEPTCAKANGDGLTRMPD